MLTISGQGLEVQQVVEVQVFGLLLHEPTRKSEASFSAFCSFPVTVQTKPSQCLSIKSYKPSMKPLNVPSALKFLSSVSMCSYSNGFKFLLIFSFWMVHGFWNNPTLFSHHSTSSTNSLNSIRRA